MLASLAKFLLIFCRRIARTVAGNLVYFATTLQAAEHAATSPLTPFYHLNLEGREPAMTRIPLNRAYEQSQDLKDKLEMSTAEIGLAVRTTNCLEERGVFTVERPAALHARRPAEHLQLRREDARRSLQGAGKRRLLPPRPPAGRV